LIGDPEALEDLLAVLRAQAMPLALNSSRPTASVRRTLEAGWPTDTPPPDALNTALEYALGARDTEWQDSLGGWRGAEMDRVAGTLGFTAHTE